MGYFVAVRNVEMYRDAFRGDLELEACDKVDTLLEYIEEGIDSGKVVQEIPNLKNSIYALKSEQTVKIL